MLRLFFLRKKQIGYDGGPFLSLVGPHNMLNLGILMKCNKTYSFRKNILRLFYEKLKCLIFF